MKIIHIASDQKFINSAYFQFEAIYPGENIFYLLVEDPAKPLQFVQKHEHMILVKQGVEESKKLPEKFGNASLIFFHGLDYSSSIILNRTPEKYKKIWILWGMEIYSNPYLFKSKNILGSKTLQIFNKDKGKKRLDTILKNILRNVFFKLKYQTQKPHQEILSAMKNAEFWAISYEEEYNLIKKKLGVNKNYIQYFYYPIEKMLSNPENRVSGNNILLGNSASYSNNHLESFLILKKLDLDDRKLITPLSYGDRIYKDQILEIGLREFGNNFEPLIDFMPLHEYNAYIQKCGIVIMNHHRQQAVGNILTMLWMGAKVYLNQQNTLYHYLKRIGVYVYTVSEDLLSGNPDVLKQLDEEKQLHNRSVLGQEIGEEVLLKKLQVQIEKIK